MPGQTHTHTETKFHEYSWLHKLCFTSTNSRQTFSQNAHEADPLSLPSSALLNLPLSALSINPAHSASPSVSSPFSISLPLPTFPISSSLSPLFLYYLPFPIVSSVLRILTHMACFDDHSHHGQTPSTCVTSLSLNYPPLIGAAWGMVYLKPTPVLTDKSFLTCYLMHALERLTTFDLIAEWAVFLFLSVSDFHLDSLPLLLKISTHHIFSIFTLLPSASSTLLILCPLLKPSLPVLSTNLPLPLLPTDRNFKCLHTWEGDVESLQRYGEVRNEA